MGIVFIAVVVLIAFAAGVMGEHYLHPPKLDKDQLFDAIELIDDYGRHSEDRFLVQVLRNELNLWMDIPGACAVSKELKEIIDKVKNEDNGAN